MLTKDFITAGNATFTIDTPDSGHRTYKVEHVEATERWKESWFVKLLTGSDNESDYSYIGKLDTFTGYTTTTARSTVKQDSYPMRLLNRVLARVWTDDHKAYTDHGFSIHHEGKCGRCGRKLTVPASIQSGIGPECQRKMDVAPKAATLGSQEFNRLMAVPVVDGVA